MKKLTGKEIIEILLENYSLNNIGYGEWYETEKKIDVIYSDGLIADSKLCDDLISQRTLFVKDKRWEEYSKDPIYKDLTDNINNLDIDNRELIEMLSFIGLGEIVTVQDDGGGEGGSENVEKTYHFKYHDVYIKVLGSYYSHHGYDWYNEPYQVFPVERLVTFYESVR